MRAGSAATFFALFLWSAGAFAYRPFDSTDAAVAPLHEAELELGPVGYLQEDHAQFLVTPALIANVGVLPGCELVLEGRNEVRLGETTGEGRVEISDAAISLKGVLRSGVLQDRSGPSIATEIGALLPETQEESGVGASGALIVSERAAFGTAHLNAGLLFTRNHEAGAFGGLILEGPIAWTVRPVAEVFVEREFAIATVYSGLVGAIWRLSDSFALDAAFRRGSDEGVALTEVRAGLTWAFEL